MYVSYFWYKPSHRFMRSINVKKDARINPSNFSKINKQFKKLLKKSLKAGGLNKFYYLENKIPLADVYLRYESLKDDFDKFSDSLKIPRVNIPHLLSNSRKNKRHYSTYYDNELITNHYKDMIDYFGYKFETK